jgi:hemerythrin
MDNQHKELIAILNQFYDAVERGERDEGIPIFEGADQYANYHLSSEEEFLERIQYPELDAHRALHEMYRREYRALMERYQQGDRKAIRELTAFLLSWLYTHIQKADRKYAAFFHQASQG